MAKRQRRKTPVVEEKVNSEDRIIASYKDKVTGPLTAIRAMCVECMGGGVKEVGECVTATCALHPFRMGKNTMHGRYGRPKNEKASKAKTT